MAEVEQTIARIRKTRGQPAAADYLQARLLMHKKEWAKAAALLERTRPALAAQQAHADLIGQIDLCLGQCYLALEEPAQAERAFRLVLELGRQPGGGPSRPGRGAARPGPGGRGAGQLSTRRRRAARTRARAGCRWPAWRSCASSNRTTPAATGRRPTRPSTGRPREIAAGRRPRAPTRRCCAARSWRPRASGTTPRSC